MSQFHLTEVALGAQLADMKDVDYRNTLAIASLIELLTEKGVISRQELARKAQTLDALTEAEIALRRPPSVARWEPRELQ